MPPNRHIEPDRRERAHPHWLPPDKSVSATTPPTVWAALRFMDRVRHLRAVQAMTWRRTGHDRKFLNAMAGLDVQMFRSSPKGPRSRRKCARGAGFVPCRAGAAPVTLMNKSSRAISLVLTRKRKPVLPDGSTGHYAGRRAIRQSGACGGSPGQAVHYREATVMRAPEQEC